MSLASFQFIDPGPLIDRELELVAPDLKWANDMLTGCRHPMTARSMPSHARTTHDQIVTMLHQQPMGRLYGDPRADQAPSYQFWMRLRPEYQPLLPIAGSIGLRVGETENLTRYLGQIGYHVFPAVRGHHLAERSCRLLLPLAKAHGMRELWITCNPDNIASRRTCERLGCELVEIVDVPRNNSLYMQGDFKKCRYRLPLA